MKKVSIYKNLSSSSSHFVHNISEGIEHDKKKQKDLSELEKFQEQLTYIFTYSS